MAEQMEFSTEDIDMSEWEIYELLSEESDDEDYDFVPDFKDHASISACSKKLDLTASESFRFESDAEAKSSADPNNSSAEKNPSVLDSNITPQDACLSSEESNSSESSTERAYVCKYQEVFDSQFVVVEVKDEIVDSDLTDMIKKFRAEHYSASLGLSKVDLMVGKCKMLYERDYHCEVVDNLDGELCTHYPVRIIVPVAVKSSEDGADRSDGVEFDKVAYTVETKKSAACRLRKRFVVPVIMFDKKFICRSGTITVRKTAAYETASQTSNPQSENVNVSPIKRKARHIVRTVVEKSSSTCQAARQFLTPDSIRRLRDIDAQILRDLKVQYICDLMIEDRKKFQNVTLSSSEKINPEIYHSVNIEQMPYPGCGFFKWYHKAQRNPEGMIFNWERPDADTILKFTEDPTKYFPDIVWDNYKKWDLVKLTKNYMKILLLYLAKGLGGLLVHCVSGWDRTPLFISMLRVSLWADGVIHQSLNYLDMAYLTLTYDWYLFGHDLPNRLKKKEEIMHFCFKFLPYIVDDEFSLTRIFHELPVEQQGNGSLPDFKPGVRTAINDVCSCVLAAYDKCLSELL